MSPATPSGGRNAAGAGNHFKYVLADTSSLDGKKWLPGQKTGADDLEGSLLGPLLPLTVEAS
jgi:hypothetical protein